MKRILTAVLSILMVFSIMGCGAKKQAAAAWTINVEGAKDKAVEFTSIDYDKLGTVDVEATLKKKDGTEQKQKWTGVPLAKVIESLGVKEYSKVTVEAKDGYKKDYTPDLVKDEGTILAAKVDGKALEGDAAPIELVLKSQSGNMWIKSVAKITIEK